MSVAPATSSSILVVITGVTQAPSVYSVVGTTLTFSTAPPSGTANISVRYLGIPASGVTTTAYRTLTEFTATASQTTFTPPSYTVGFIAVYQNGVMLGSTDYTATNGTTVVLAVGALVNDLISTESFYVSSVLNALPVTGGTISGNLVVTGDVNLTGSFYAKSNNYFGETNGYGSMQHYTSTNWNYSNLNLWRNATNTSTPRFLGMPLDGDAIANTTIGGFNAIWGAYDSAPTTGSTSSGLNGKIVYGAYAGHQWYTNGTERMRIDSSGNLLFNSGYGSAATAYGCRAWVNFNGTGTVAIRSSGNVSSITDNGTGYYTVNFTTAMVDANYAVTGFGQYPSGAPVALVTQDNTTDVWTTTTVSVKTVNSTTSTVIDFAKVAVSVFR